MAAARGSKKAARKEAPKPRSQAAPRSPKRPRSRRKPAEGEPDRGGRPAIEWGEQAARDVHRLARAGNTVADMAEILGVSKRSLETAIAGTGEVGESYRRAVAERHNVLRAAQLRAALKGNPAMLIWLGKQELGQRDYKRLEVVGDGGGSIAIEGDLAPVVKQKLLEFLRSRGKKPDG